MKWRIDDIPLIQQAVLLGVFKDTTLLPCPPLQHAYTVTKHNSD